MTVDRVLVAGASGEKAGETLLVSQRVFPRRLAAAGFDFRHPDAATTVAALVK